MCKYCKRLKELKDLDEKRLMKLAKYWKRVAESNYDLVDLFGKMLLVADYYNEDINDAIKKDMARCERRLHGRF